MYRPCCDKSPGYITYMREMHEPACVGGAVIRLRRSVLLRIGLSLMSEDGCAHFVVNFP